MKGFVWIDMGQSLKYINWKNKYRMLFIISFGGKVDTIIHVHTDIYLITLNPCITNVYMCVDIPIWSVIHTFTISRRLCQKNSPNRDYLCKGGPREIADWLFYLLFLHHFNIFSYSKMHRNVYLYIEIKTKNRFQLRRLIGNTVSYWVLQNLW